jgi:L-iditol 2-dehydrogenase
VGQWAAQTLAWAGAEVLLVGHHPDRLDKFAHKPLRHSICAKHGEWVETAQNLFPDGIQVSVDTVGSVPVVEALMTLMRRYGHIVSAGFYGTEDLLGLQAPRNGELSMDFVSGWSRERMDRTRDLTASGQLETLPLVTHHFPVSQAAAAWRLITTKHEPVLGVILDW